MYIRAHNLMCQNYVFSDNLRAMVNTKHLNTQLHIPTCEQIILDAPTAYVGMPPISPFLVLFLNFLYSIDHFCLHWTK
jgi:hypothetical protein